MAGGIRSDYVLCEFPGGSSWKFNKVSKPGAAKGGGSQKHDKTNKSPMAYVKEDVAKFFEIPRPVYKDIGQMMIKEQERTYNPVSTEGSKGEKRMVKSMATSMGATGKGRSVRVVFKSPQQIGGKSVASVNIPIPSAYTIGDINEFLMAGRQSSKIAQIVSDKGKAMRYATRSRKSKTNKR